MEQTEVMRWYVVHTQARSETKSHGVVETLSAKYGSRLAISLAAMRILTKGLRVRIKSGTFNGQMSEITETFLEGRDRVRVLLTLLGSKTELLLPSYAIEAA